MTHNVNIWHSGSLFDPCERVTWLPKGSRPTGWEHWFRRHLLFGLLLVPDLGQCCFFTLEESGHSQDLSTWSWGRSILKTKQNKWTNKKTLDATGMRHGNTCKGQQYGSRKPECNGPLSGMACRQCPWIAHRFQFKEAAPEIQSLGFSVCYVCPFMTVRLQTKVQKGPDTNVSGVGKTTNVRQK